MNNTIVIIKYNKGRWRFVDIMFKCYLEYSDVVQQSIQWVSETNDNHQAPNTKYNNTSCNRPCPHLPHLDTYQERLPLSFLILRKEMV